MAKTEKDMAYIDQVDPATVAGLANSHLVTRILEVYYSEHVKQFGNDMKIPDGADVINDVGDMIRFNMLPGRIIKVEFVKAGEDPDTSSIDVTSGVLEVKGDCLRISYTSIEGRKGRIKQRLIFSREGAENIPCKSIV